MSTPKKPKGRPKKVDSSIKKNDISLSSDFGDDCIDSTQKIIDDSEHIDTGMDQNIICAIIREDIKREQRSFNAKTLKQHESFLMASMRKDIDNEKNLKAEIDKLNNGNELYQQYYDTLQNMDFEKQDEESNMVDFKVKCLQYVQQYGSKTVPVRNERQLILDVVKDLMKPVVGTKRPLNAIQSHESSSSSSEDTTSVVE